MANNLDMRKEDSLKSRYFSKLGTNLLGLVISLVTQSIIPRGLSPSAYGNFSFLSTFFTQIVSFFDAGTSISFYTKLCQNTKDIGLIKLYNFFVLIVSVFTIILLVIILAIGAGEFLWTNQEAIYIWMALFWSLFMWYSQILNKVLDAYGLTIKGEIIRIQQRFLGMSLILLMFFLNRFSLTEFFLYHYVILLFLCLSWWNLLRKQGINLFPKIKQTTAEIKSYSKEFYHYSSPLVIYSFVGLLAGLFDRWILQNFSGSIEQGFYELSYQIGAVCFLFTSSMTPLLTREFAKAFGEEDLLKMRRLFQRYIPLLYAIAAYFSTFVFIQANKISLIVGGQAYIEASLAIGLMSFYPIHQTYGQLSGAVFYATGQTRLYRNIGIFVCLIGIPATIFLIAPSSWLGLDLGATGLAIKMVTLQFLSVNLQLWFNTKFLGISFWRFFAHQVYCVALLIALAWLAAESVDILVSQSLLSFLVSGLIYTIECIVVAFLLPSVFGLHRNELTNLVNSFFKS